MAQVKEEGSASLPPTTPRLILHAITSTARAIITTLSPPPLLPVSSGDASSQHPIAQNLRNLELGKLALTVGTTAALGLLFSQKFAPAEAHYLLVVGLMVGCAAVWNGILLGNTYVEVVGISLILLCLFGLVASFLPLRFSWACWLAGAFSLIPFLCLLLKPPHQVE